MAQSHADNVHCGASERCAGRVTSSAWRASRRKMLTHFGRGHALRLRYPRWAAWAMVLLATAAQARAAQLTLVADAHVNAARPAANSGAISNLDVGAGYTSLLQFDLTALPAGTTPAQIARATLRLFSNRVDTAGTVRLQGISSAWGEYSVTYATLPPIASSSASVPITQAGTYVSVDVTAFVQGWLTNPASNNGIALTSTDAVAQFDSKENDLTGHAPQIDVVLVSQGPAGPKGDKGDPGATGPQGQAGAVGPVGAQGATGPAGPQGPQGPQGLQGVAGPTGAQGTRGPAGPVGMAFRGEFQEATTYSTGDGVTYGGAAYVSLADGNLSNPPDLNPALWGKFAAGSQGPAGPAGPPGVAGPPGPQGLQGSVGLTGATGPQGAQGPAGVQGPAGPMGPSGPIGSTGATGSQGVQGLTGPAGPAGINFKGAWSSATAYRANDAVSYSGSTYLALATNLAVPPDSSTSAWAVLAQTGSAGPSGPAGTAATVTVGAVTTGAPGTAAVVTNAGTSTTAVLNFTIPQGQPGANGSTGSGTGTSGGGSFASTYHSVSFSSNYYSVSSANAAANEPGSVLTWVPSGCTATSLAAYSQQGNTIQVILRTGMPGAMAATSLACTVSTNSSCTSAGTVTIAPGTFIDLQITGSNGTLAPVWTSLACN